MLIFLGLAGFMLVVAVRGSAMAIVRSWCGLLVLYAALPQFGGNLRVGGIPAEYLPIFALLAGLSLRTIMSEEARKLSRMPTARWPLMILGTMYLVTLPIAPRPTAWFLAVLTVGGQLAAFGLASRSLNALIAPQREAVQQLFLAGTCAFAAIGSARSVFTTGRHPGDFSAIIEFRSSEVIILLAALPVAATRWVKTNEGRDLAMTGLLAGAVLLTFSRTAALGLAGIVTILAFTSHRSLGVQRFWSRALIGLLIAGVGLAGLSFVQGDAIAARLRSSVEAVSIWTDEELEFGQSGGRRRAVQQATIEQLRESPWLGTGPGELLPSLDVNVERLRSRSHNLYLSYGAEYGIVGLTALLGVFGTTLGRAITARREAVVDDPVSAAPIALIIPLFGMFLFQEFVSAPYLWMSIALLLSMSGCLDSDATTNGKAINDQVVGDGARRIAPAATLHRA